MSKLEASALFTNKPPQDVGRRAVATRRVGAVLAQEPDSLQVDRLRMRSSNRSATTAA